MAVTTIPPIVPAQFTRYELITSSTTWRHPDNASPVNPKWVYLIMTGGGQAGSETFNTNPSAVANGNATIFGDCYASGASGANNARPVNHQGGASNTAGTGGSFGPGLNAGVGNSTLPVQEMNPYAAGGGSGGTTNQNVAHPPGVGFFGTGGTGSVYVNNTAALPGSGYGFGGGGCHKNSANNIQTGPGGGAGKVFVGYYVVTGDVTVTIGTGSVSNTNLTSSGGDGAVYVYY